MWVQDGSEQQYYVTLKFNFYRGFGGAMWSIFRYYFLGLICTWIFLAWLKRWGHDLENYYNVKYLALEKQPGYHHGLGFAIMNNWKQYYNANSNQDVLGRSIIN